MVNRRRPCSPSPPAKRNPRSRYSQIHAQEQMAAHGVRDSIEVNAWNNILNAGNPVAHIPGQFPFDPIPPAASSTSSNSRMQDFEFVGVIGEGASSVVYRVRNRYNQQWYNL